jgi:hypothetical protein
MVRARRRLLVLLLLALGGAAAIVAIATGLPSRAEQSPERTAPAGGQPSATPARSATPGLSAQPGTRSPKQDYPRLDSLLNQLVAQLGQQAPADVAAQAPLARGDAVAVSIRVAGDPAPVRDWLAGQGVQIANMSGDVIEAYVPVTALAALSNQPGVLAVTAIVPPRAG